MKRIVNFVNQRKKLTAWVIIILVLFAGYFYYQEIHQIMPQPVIYFLNDIKTPLKDEKIVLFSPHPDDETIAAGGYIKDATDRGAQVYIVLVTDGNKHGLKDMRYNEFKQVTTQLGINANNLIFLNYSDGKLSKVNQIELTNKFNKILDEINPSIVLFPYPNDTHPDHAITGRYVIDAIKSQNTKPTTYAYLVHNPNYPEPKNYEPEMYLLPPQGLVQFDQEWKRYMLTPEEENNKKSALEKYKSQIFIPFLRNLMYGSIRKNEIFVEEKF